MVGMTPVSRSGTEEAPRDPWARFAWALGIVWVVFLIFPIASVSSSDAPPAARMIAIVLLVVYGLVYIAVFVWMTASADWTQAAGRGLAGLSVMFVLMLGAALLTDIGALGAAPFLVSIAMFSGPRRRAIILATSILLAVVATFTITGTIGRYWMIVMAGLMVYLPTLAVRLIDGAQDAHNEMERQLAVVAERERVARDVHDVLGHSLTVVTVKSELAERLVDLDPEAAKAELAQIRSLSREALAEVRATVAGLRVARLSDELAAARAALADAGIEADVPSDADAVDPRHRIVVAWTLREAVTNVVRHSRASRCVVTLATDGIVVEDDGIGMRPEDIASGLRGVRERAEAAGARLTAGPATGGTGTRIEVRW